MTYAFKVLIMKHEKQSKTTRNNNKIPANTVEVVEKVQFSKKIH